MHTSHLNLARHHFVRTMTLGVVTSSAIESNHGVMKRDANNGGAGISARDKVVTTLTKLSDINCTRKTQCTQFTDKCLLPLIPDREATVLVSKYLTPFARKLFISQLDESVHYFIDSQSSHVIKVRHSSKIREVRLNREGRMMCDCPFSHQYVMPCRRLLRVSGGVVELGDFHYRWFILYYRQEFIPTRRYFRYLGMANQLETIRPTRNGATTTTTTRNGATRRTRNGATRRRETEPTFFLDFTCATHKRLRH